MLESKVHRATITQADLHYVGSLTLDRDLMDSAGLLPGERVDVVDINNGARLSTYIIEGAAGSGVVGINGAAAQFVTAGDLIIISAYAIVDDLEAAALRPRVVFVDQHNQITGTGADPSSGTPETPVLAGAR